MQQASALGYSSFVASFSPDTGIGHAVCMVYLSEKPPADYGWHSLEGWYGFPVGNYVPIDYNHVCELSNAVEEGCSLRNLFRPKEIYGRYI